MPFTNAWSNVIPAGAVSAKLIDDHIRQLRLDIFERMNSKLFNDFTADPLVIKSELSGAKVGKQIILHASAFTSTNNSKERIISASGNYVTAFTDTGTLVAPLPLPRGSAAGPLTLRLVEFMVEKGDAGSLVMALQRRHFLAAEPRDGGEILTTATEVGAGVKVVALPAISIGITEGDITFHYLTIDATGTAGNSFYVFGVRVTYDVLDARATY